MDHMADLIAEAKGKEYFDRFRGQISLFKKREEILLKKRNRYFEISLQDGISTEEEIQESLRWVNHTYNVLNKADKILAAAVDMETGMRGYLLAGKEEFLDPYKNGQAELFSLILEMQKTVDDNPAQVKLLSEIYDNMQSWKKNVTEVMIGLRRSVNENKKMFHMADLVSEARGKKYFDEFRALMKDFKAEEERLIVIRQKSNTETAQNTFDIIIICSVISIVLGLVVSFFISRGITAPLKHMTENMASLSEGDTSINIEGSDRKDEVGDMARAMEKLLENRKQADSLIELDKRRAEREEEKAERERREKQAAEELSEVVKACAVGNFTKRLETSDKEGIFLNLCNGMNNIGQSADRGLSEIQSVLSALSEGRLDTKISGEYEGIFHDIKISFNSTIEKLTKIISEISESTETVIKASHSMMEGTKSLSERTDQQAASLEDTASTMEELTSTIKENADHALSANSCSVQADDKAKQGDDVMNNVVSAMEKIGTSSHQISDIISIIDEISSQINLLALNAAVEAARAGEAGRGFSVVAGEVRSLAARSADASHNIRELINSSKEQVFNGTQQVNEASQSLKDIITSVQDVSSSIKKISAASIEQSHGVSEINNVVAQMDNMTQQNAALAESNMMTTRDMLLQVEHLKSLVDFFQTQGKTQKKGRRAA